MQMPDFCNTSIHSARCFSFRLPVTAFGFHDPMIIEISVDYFLSDDETLYYANVWARQDHGRTKGFILPMTVPATDNPEIDIFEALNENEQFESIIKNFINILVKHSK